jgi:plasminogen activator
MPRVGVALLAAALVAGAPGAAHALHASSSATGPGALQFGGGEFSFALDASVGLVGGTATELAFDYPLGNKYKVSELSWDLKGVAMAGIQGSAAYGRRLRLNVGFWSALGKGSGTMVDRDWLYTDVATLFITPSDSNWTDESRHPNTSVDKGTLLDLNVSVLALESGPFSLSGILGYKRDTWGWSSRGGTFVYTYNSFRDTTGDFEELFGKDVLVISYEQRFTIPYAGVEMAWTSPAVRVAAHLLASGLVSATDTDRHVLREVSYRGDFSKGTYLGLGAGVTWDFAPRWAATLGLEYQSISEITGDVHMSGAEGDQTFSAGGGLAMSAVMGSLGIGCRF